MDFIVDNKIPEKEIGCKNCETLYKKWLEVKKQRDDKEKELINLSRKYTKNLHLIDLLNEST